MDGGAWWATVHGVAKSQTRLSDFTFTFHFHALEKEMAPHSSVLAWRIPGMGERGWAAIYGVAQSRTRLKQQQQQHRAYWVCGSQFRQETLRMTRGWDLLKSFPHMAADWWWLLLGPQYLRAAPPALQEQPELLHSMVTGFQGWASQESQAEAVLPFMTQLGRSTT